MNLVEAFCHREPTVEEHCADGVAIFAAALDAVTTDVAWGLLKPTPTGAEFKRFCDSYIDRLDIAAKAGSVLNAVGVMPAAFEGAEGVWKVAQMLAAECLTEWNSLLTNKGDR